MDVRTLPHNLEAERSVLGAIIIDNACYQVAASVLHPSMFFRDAHRRIYERMMNLSIRSAPIDLITLKEELERAGDLDEVGGPAYIAALIDGMPRSTNVEYYAQIVREHATRRHVILDMGRTIHRAYENESIEDIAVGLRGTTKVLESLGVEVRDTEYNQLEYETRKEVRKQKAISEAKHRLSSERFAAVAVPQVQTLGALLAEQDPPQEWLIDRLFPANAVVLLVAMGKSGKTTLRNNLIRSLVDGDDFLGEHASHHSGGVFLFDMEMTAQQSRRWLRDVGIRNQSAVHLVLLKQSIDAFNLFDPQSFAYWSDQVRATGASLVVLDTLKPALDVAGLNEREEAGRYLRKFASFLGACGAANGFTCHHTGWSTDRARGDSGLLDAPDVTWTLTRARDDKGEVADMTGVRSFRALGRDVEFPQTDLVYAPESRRLSLASMSTQESKADRALRIICGIISRVPDNPLGVTAIEGYAAVEALSKKPANDALREALTRGYIRRITGKARGAYHHVILPAGLQFLASAPAPRSAPNGSVFLPSQRPTPFKGGGADAERGTQYPSVPEGGPHAEF